MKEGSSHSSFFESEIHYQRRASDKKELKLPEFEVFTNEQDEAANRVESNFETSDLNSVLDKMMSEGSSGFPAHGYQRERDKSLMHILKQKLKLAISEGQPLDSVELSDADKKIISRSVFRYMSEEESSSNTVENIIDHLQMVQKI